MSSCMGDNSKAYTFIIKVIHWVNMSYEVKQHVCEIMIFMLRIFSKQNRTSCINGNKDQHDKFKYGGTTITSNWFL